MGKKFQKKDVAALSLKIGNWQTGTVGWVFVGRPYESGMIDKQCHFTNLREPEDLEISGNSQKLLEKFYLLGVQFGTFRKCYLKSK